MIFLILLVSLIQGTRSWVVLYEAILTNQSTCSNLLLDKYWTSSSGSTIQACDNSCVVLPFTKISYILDDQSSFIKITVPIPSTLSSMYTQFGVDATVHIQKQPNIQVQINNNSPQTISNFEKSEFEDDFSYICDWKPYDFYKVTSRIIQSNAEKSLSIKFIKDAPNKEFGIRYLRIWASCAQNCQVCSDKDDCQTCFAGLQRFVFPETGKGACETTQNCNISNCFSCAVSSNRNVCLKCIAGYSLDSSNQCQKNSGKQCSQGQYLEQDGNCMKFANKCYYEDRQTGNILKCNNVDTSKYQCQNSDYIFVLNKYNYGEVRCGCYDSNCEECSNQSTCKTCSSGYQLNSSTKKCEKICTQEGTFYNSNKSQCQNCSDHNCTSCTSSQCLTCKKGYILNLQTKLCISNCPDGQYFNSSQQSCQLCSSGCQLCTSTSDCQKCQSNLIWNGNLNKCVVTCQSPQVFDETTEKCITCDSNCFQCTSISCQICQDITYEIDQSNKKKCKRIPLNCSSNQFYDQTNYICVDCSPFCSSCNQIYCLTCVDDTYQIDSNNLNNCEKKPLNCGPNQYEDKINHICVNCQLNCLSCDSISCLKCIDNTYQVDINDLNKCKRVPLNCSQGQYYDENTYSCKSCNQNCLKCDENKCLQCDNLSQVILDDIQNCQLIPLNCKSNEYFDKQKHSCEKCSINCKTCNSKQCTQCIDLTYTLDPLQITQCIQRDCSQNCKVCDQQNCQQCINNNFMIDKNFPLNCILKCNIQNCKSCSLSNNSQCSQCEDGYYLNLKDYTCGIGCLVNNCSECESNNQNLCSICNQDFSLIEQTKQCKEICQQINCKECQSNQPKQCKLCEDGYTLDQNEYYCYKPTKKKNNFQIKQEVQDNVYNIQIIFDQYLIQQLKNYENNKKIIELTIEDRYDFSFVYDQKNQNQIDIQLIMQNEIKNKKLQISLNSNQFKMENNLEEDKGTVELKPFVKISSSQKEAGEKIGQVAQGVSLSISSSILPIVILSNFYVLVNTIDITAFYYYILFIDVRLPENVINFFAIFQDFQFPFIPNMFQGIINDTYIQYSPKKFIENGCQGYFITNGGQSITICCGLMLLYLLARIGQLLPIRFINQYCSRAIQRTWHYSGFFDICCTVYIYLLFAVFLQFYSFSFDDSISPLNYILFFSTALAVIPLPLFILRIFQKIKNIKSNKDFQQKYSSLLSGLKLYDEKTSIKQQEVSIVQSNNLRSSQDNYDMINSPTVPISTKILIPIAQSRCERMQIKYTKYYYGYCYLRKLIFALIVTFLHQVPYLQLILISLFNIFFISYIYYIKPFQKKHENIKNIAGEFSLVIIQLSVCLLVSDKEDQKEDERYNIGWVIIGSSGIILLWNTLQIIYELFCSIYSSLYSLICFKRKQNKIQSAERVRHKRQNKQSVCNTNNNIETEFEFTKQPKDRQLYSIPSQNDLQKSLPHLNFQSSAQTTDDVESKISQNKGPNNASSNIVFHAPLQTTSSQMEIINTSPGILQNESNPTYRMSPLSLNSEENYFRTNRRKRTTLLFKQTKSQILHLFPIQEQLPVQGENKQEFAIEEKTFR